MRKIYKDKYSLFKKFLITLISVFIAGVVCVEYSFAKESALKSKKIDKNQNKASQTPLQGNVVIDIDSEQVDYLPDEEQFVATGNVVIHVFPQNTILEAKKVTYDKAEDLIIAEKDVKITKDKQVITGDYGRFDLTTDSMLLENPITELNKIRIVSKKANIYPSKKDPNKKIIDSDAGTATISDPNMSFFISSSGTKFVRRENLSTDNGTKKSKNNKPKPEYLIHSKEIIVDRDEYTDIITLKNSVIIFNKKYKIAKIPSVLMTADKDTTRAETTFPEIGQMPDLGGYVGYGPVFVLPRGATLKIAPLFTYGSGVGGGGLARFMTDRNRTQIAYSTLKEKVVLNGEHLLSKPHKRILSSDDPQQNDTDSWTKIQYGSNSYIDNGMMGSQKPAFIVEVVDDRRIGSAYNIDFDLRSTAAYIEDYNKWSTGRFQVQGNFLNRKPVYKIGKYIDLGVSSQFAMAAYGNGDSYGILRGGPSISTTLGPAYFWAAYYQGGIYGESPFEFDRYYYGRSNVTLNSTYKVNDFIFVGYTTSLNLKKDNYDNTLLAENRFYVWLGPEDIKFMLAYDTRRKATTFDFNMFIGADRSKIQFDRMKIREK